ncbi:hypothetical protein Tco_1371123 [Tanacetum coccineum]
MVAGGGNIMRKTPQEAYDLIENMTHHHFQWDAKVYYDTTTDMSAHYSKTTFALNEQVEVLGNDTRYTIQSVQHQPGPDNPSTFHYSYSNESNEVEPLEVLNVQKSIHPLSGSPTLSSNSIIESLSPSLTPIGNSNFLLEKTDAFLSLDSIPLGIDNETFDADRDILLLEKLLNIDSIRDLPPQELNNEIFDAERDILLLEKLLDIDSTKDPPPQELNNDLEGDILFLETLLKDDPSDARTLRSIHLLGNHQIPF